MVRATPITKEVYLKTFKPIIPLLMVLIGTAAVLYPADSMEGPKPTLTPTTTIAPTLTSTPSPTPTSTPTITPTSTVTPLPTLDQVSYITTEYILDMTMPWGVLVEYYRWDSDPETALILSVIAAESMGDPSVVSYAGACGVMQVIWKPWFQTSKAGICNNSHTNIAVGIRILRGALRIAKEEGLDERYGLAYYNCSVESVHADMCGSKGGLHYADKILDFWLPRVEDRIMKCIDEYGENFWGSRDGYDLPGCSW
jgi:hypothetical protein